MSKSQRVLLLASIGLFALALALQLITGSFWAWVVAIGVTSTFVVLLRTGQLDREDRGDGDGS
jgi:hypothetical protein